MSVLDVFSHRARVGIALSAAWKFAGVRFTCDMRFHVLRPITRVVEAFVTPLIVTHIRLLSSVSSYV